MAVEVVMPKFGLTMQEGTIQQWFKGEGDAVRKGEPLFEVETEKVLYEVEAPASGVVATLLYGAEATVPCATVVAIIALEADDAQAIAHQYRLAGKSATREFAAAHETHVPRAPGGRRAAPPITPAARRLAKDRGIDLATVSGTGPGGRVTREDVETAIRRAFESGAATAQTTTASPLQGMRKSIAERMLKSLQTTAQLTITNEADATALVARRERLNREFSVTYTDLLIEAVAAALREHPRLNVTAEGETVQQHEQIDIGVAVALDDGLVVPVIRAADQKSVREIAAESRVLADKARSGRLSVDDVSGGTFTITNLGMYDVDAFTPILHAPQVAILGVGRVVERPRVHEGLIAVRATMVLSLTFDHRIVDGAPAAAFLRSVVAHLQANDAPSSV